MQPNSNLKGWSMYRSPAVPFQKCQYSPLIYQNFNIFLNNDFIDFQLKSKLNTKISEGLIKQEGVINKYNNSNLKNRQSINTDKLEEKADNMKINFSLENVSTPHLKPQENILNIYNLNNENFKKFQSSIITKGNKSSIFSSSLTSEQINPLDQKKLKYETKIIINQDKKVQFKCDESYLDNEKEFGEEESLEDDEEWVPSKENELLKNKRKNLKADKTIEYSLSELELIKKSIISTIKLRNNHISKKARKIALTNFTNLINSKGTILRKNLLNLKGFNFFSDLKKKMNECIYLFK